MKTISALLLLGALLTGAFAQRPRAVEPDPATQTAKPRPAPKTLKAKYEGGVFGYTKTMEGTLSFDDKNNRLLFKDKKPPKESRFRMKLSLRPSRTRRNDNQRQRQSPATYQLSTRFRRASLKPRFAI